MMDNFISLITSSKGMLLNCMELLDVLKYNIISGEITNDKNEKVLNDMMEMLKKLIRNIISVKMEIIVSNTNFSNKDIVFLQNSDIKVLLVDIADRTIISDKHDVIKNLNDEDIKLTENDISNKETLNIIDLCDDGESIYCQKSNEKNHMEDNNIVLKSDEVINKIENDEDNRINILNDDKLSVNTLRKVDEENINEIKQCYVVVKDIQLLKNIICENIEALKENDPSMSDKEIEFYKLKHFKKKGGVVNGNDEALFEDNLASEEVSVHSDDQCIKNNLSPINELCTNINVTDKMDDEDCIIIEKEIETETDDTRIEKTVNVIKEQRSILKYFETDIDKDLEDIDNLEDIEPNGTIPNEVQLNVNNMMETEYIDNSMAEIKGYAVILDEKNNLNYDKGFSYDEDMIMSNNCLNDKNIEYVNNELKGNKLYDSEDEESFKVDESAATLESHDTLYLNDYDSLNNNKKIVCDLNQTKITTSFIKENDVEVRSNKGMTEDYDTLRDIKECLVVLHDIYKYKTISDEDYFNELENEVNKLCQVPKFKNKKSLRKDKLKKKTIISKKTSKSKNNSLSSRIFESDSNDSISDLEGDISDIDLTNIAMNDSCLSSTESDQSSQCPKKTLLSATSKSKLRLSDNLFGDLLKVKAPKIPLLSNKKANIIVESPESIVCLSSDSDNESDASVSDLRIMDSQKRKKTHDTGVLSKRRKIDNEENSKNDVVKRKNIRKIITKSKLSEATKSAEQLEVERRLRMEEKQKLYNNSIINKSNSVEGDASSLVIENDQNGDSLIEVHKYIAEKLKPHQIEAVHFMYECVIENVQRFITSQQEAKSSYVGGCIIAHCMGLGKTLSLIAFMHTMLTSTILNVQTCIIVCPVNTALNWKNEWEMWVPPDRPVNLFEVCSNETKKNKFSIIEDWQIKGGVLIIGYEMFRNLTNKNSRSTLNKTMQQKMLEALVNPGADFIVCDEGHLLKNEKSAISKVINTVKTRCRIVLTGTPLQNRLIEYHTMVNFVKPNLLGSQKEFLNRFANPISNGQHINSTQQDVKIMKKRSHILFKALDGCVHRRDYSSLVKYLPPKYEYVIKIRMSNVQIELYKAYLSNIEINRHNLFEDQTFLSRVWTHPFLICMYQEIQDKKMFLADSDEEFPFNDSNDDSGDNIKIKYSKNFLDKDNIVNLISDDSDDDVNETDKMEIKEKNEDESNVSTRMRTRNSLMETDDIPKLQFELENLNETSTLNKHWWSEIIDPKHEHQIEISGKLSILFEILRKAGDMGDKVIIFSHSLLVLDIIEKYLLQLHIIAEKVHNDFRELNETLSNARLAEISGKNIKSNFCSEIGYNTWERGIDYDRMDGSTQIITRADIQARFNSEDERRLRLFLISTRAGGMGVNLVAANRVVIFDVSWNPSNDIQAIFRSYRFGQNKPVYVYRMVSQGTMEEKMYERQVIKQSLSLRVIDEQQICRYFKEEDLKSLYKFTPDIYDPDKKTETPLLPKDRFLAELIQEFPQWIYSYHEHDSLLQNNEEEELTEYERQEAWKEFEDEKRLGITPVISQSTQAVFDQTQFAHEQINHMQQQYPQFAALYSQNFANLLKYTISQKPDLQLNPPELSLKMNNIFFMAVQKYNNSVATFKTPLVCAFNTSSSKASLLESTSELN